jgi:chromosome partitioning protein
MLNEDKRMQFEPKMSIQDAASFLNVSRQAVHQKLKNNGIICPKIGKKSYINFNVAKEFFSFSFNKMKIAVESVKGGTGKTTTVNNISACANTYGARVLMIDADPQGSLTLVNSVDARELPVLIDLLYKKVKLEDVIVNLSPGLDIIPSRIENIVIDNKIIFDKMPMDRLFNRLLSSVLDSYDLIILDLPPTVSQLVTAATLFSNLIVVPLNPDDFSIASFDILLDEIEQLEENFQRVINYKGFLNKYSNNTMMSNSIYETLMSGKLCDKVIKTTVRQAQEIVNLTNKKGNLFTMLTGLPVRSDFDQVTRELLEITPSLSTTLKV